MAVAITTCGNQVAGSATRLTGASRTAAGSCNACATDTYAADDGTNCLANTVCGNQEAGGTRLTGASRTTAGTCSACATDTYAANEATDCRKKSVIKLGALLSKDSLQGSVSCALAQIAIQEINLSPTILPTIDLELIIDYPSTVQEVSRGFNHLVEETKVVGIVGIPDSDIAKVIENQANLFEVPTITTGASELPALLSKTYLSRTFINSNQYAASLSAVIDLLDYSSLVVVTTTKSIVTFQRLNATIATLNRPITLHHFQYEGDDIADQFLKKDKLFDGRVFLLLTDAISTTKFFTSFASIDETFKKSFTFILAEHADDNIVRTVTNNNPIIPNGVLSIILDTAVKPDETEAITRKTALKTKWSNRENFFPAIGIDKIKYPLLFSTETFSTETNVLISSQTITENVGVVVSQNEWTFSITSQSITEIVGVAVTQGSVTGTLKTATNGATTTVVVTTAAGVTFLTTSDLIVGSVTVAFANINAVVNSVTNTGTLKTALDGATTSVVISVAPGITFVTTSDLMIGTTTILHANINTLTKIEIDPLLINDVIDGGRLDRGLFTYDAIYLLARGLNASGGKGGTLLQTNLLNLEPQVGVSGTFTINKDYGTRLSNMLILNRQNNVWLPVLSCQGSKITTVVEPHKSKAASTILWYDGTDQQPKQFSTLYSNKDGNSNDRCLSNINPFVLRGPIASGYTVTIARTSTWAASTFMTEIARIVLEEWLDYTVKIVDASSSATLAREQVLSGAVDANLVVW